MALGGGKGRDMQVLMVLCPRVPRATLPQAAAFCGWQALGFAGAFPASLGMVPGASWLLHGLAAGVLAAGSTGACKTNPRRKNSARHTEQGPAGTEVCW